ncbi:MAG: response regulator, partial [Chloroflexota bacterium]
MRNGVSEAVHGDGVVKSNRRILVVDDDPVVLRVLYDMVSSFGYGVEAAQDGFEALAKIRLDVDLVMLDLVMPGLGGYEVIRRVRREPDVGDIPIVMVTSLGMREERIRAIEAGANDFITKPVDITELKVRLASLLKMKENQDLIKRHQAELEHKVDQRTKDLRVALEEMARAQRRTYEAHL